MSRNQTFITRFLCFQKSTWEQDHRIPKIYINNHYANFYKDDIKVKTQSRHKTQKTEEDEKIVFQNKNKYKMQTYINPFEQNNNHSRTMHKIQFRSSFNGLTESIFIHDSKMCLNISKIVLGRKLHEKKNT